MKKFDLNIYRDLLSGIKDTGKPFTRFIESEPDGVLLRLDVDYDLDWAAQTAEINAELGIRACYFIQVGATLYNAAEQESIRALARIAQANQDIGLHFHHRDGSLVDVQRLKKEYEILKLLSPSAVRVVAWHNPEGELDLLNKQATDAGFICAYDENFFGPSCYVSDSNLRNTAKDILRFVQSSDESLLQILLHPFNWVAGGTVMEDILCRTFNRKLNVLLDGFNDNNAWRNGADNGIKKSLKSSNWFEDI